ncbi:MAG: ABC transporter ATP-binding protein [Pseudomonadota bacterium]
MATVNEPVIQLRGLGKRYRIGQHLNADVRFSRFSEVLMKGVSRLFGIRGETGASEYLWALKDVSFDVRDGEVLGIIGPNGSGKSTLLKLLSRITDPTAGRIELRGKVASLLEVGTGFHPELTGRENIFLNGAILGMTRVEIQTQLDDIIEFAGVNDLLDTPVKRYSSGMSVRLAFSVAAHLRPDVLIVDEVLAVGDAQFQQRCLGRLEDIARGGRTVLFVSHNLQAVANLCSRTVVLDHGQVTYDGDVVGGVQQYLEGAKAAARLHYETESRSTDPHLIRIDITQRGYDNGAFSMHLPIEVELEIELAGETGLHTHLIVDSTAGVRVCHTAETFTDNGDELTNASARRCTLPAGTLAAGEYRLSVLLTRPIDRKVMEELRHIASFSVAFTGPGTDRLDSNAVASATGPSLLQWERLL